MLRIVLVLLIVSCPGLAAAQGTTELIQFNGFTEGDLVRDQYMFRGVRFPADPAGGPFIDDGGLFDFLLDTPPGLLSLSPFAYDGGPGVVHGSVGTYVFDFVDPSNPFAGSFTDFVEVVVAFPDAGDTVLAAYDAQGALLATSTLHLSDRSLFTERLGVYAPGIRKATVTTPLVHPTIGALVDTLIYGTPVVLPTRTIQIDVRPGLRRNTIRLNDRTVIPVAILSEPGFEPALIDPAKVLLQKASPVGFALHDKNRDRVPDLIVSFIASEMQDVDASTTLVRLTAVDADGTSLVGTDSVIVQGGAPPPPAP